MLDCSVFLLFWLLHLQVVLTQASLVRKDVATLSSEEILALQKSLLRLEMDKGATGFQSLAALHGEPSQCSKADNTSVACCVHGMATFPQWHRLYVVQLEQALAGEGLVGLGVPYWDWTQPLTELPRLVQEPIFKDPLGGLGQRNAWFSGDIEVGEVHRRTARAVDDRLFQTVAPGQNSKLLDTVLHALEFDDYCQFEVHLEVAHNNIHYLVGGRHEFSMSTLEWTSYDPLFFLHHSNVDRIFAVWQELQKRRGKTYDHADCSVELFRKQLEPFNRDSNPIALTRTFSKAKDLFSYNELNYKYDNLTLGGLNMDKLFSLVEQRRGRERAFAAFTLKGLGISANVRVKVCQRDATGSDGHCEFAGDIFLLGGANEMAWEFNLPYYFDVSDAVVRLGQPLDGDFLVKAELYSVNGTLLNSSLLPPPIGAHRPARGYRDPVPAMYRTDATVVRKNVEALTEEEMLALRQALSRFQNDTSVDGFQAVAEFHGLPARCPHPDARVRYACCLHGVPTFLHWHRLFVVQVEDALRTRGLDIGIPYWDWTGPGTTIPPLADDDDYTDPITGEIKRNPFHDAPVAFLGERTSRQVQSELTQTPKFGGHTNLFDGMLLAFQQTDFCDFEIQFEVVHNAPHFLVGGYAPYSLATLHYSAFDPIFYLHHSSVDRMWAIWQALQVLRGLPYKSHCALSLTRDTLKPFGFPSPLNNNRKTFSRARGDQVYEYQKNFLYDYDSLTFGGMTIPQLNQFLAERGSKERTFVGIKLHNIGVSAWVKMYISVPGGEPYLAGSFAVLGGEQEMTWTFDRLFKVEITDALLAIGRNYDEDFDVTLDITDVKQRKWPGDTFSHKTIFHQAKKDYDSDAPKDVGRMRYNINSLTREQVQSLREALQKLQNDSSVNGFGQIAAFHGQPTWCPAPDAPTKYACCVHGMAVFPHWHRLLTVQMENALRDRGFTEGIPYWDWTLPMTSLPDLLEEESYQNQRTEDIEPNPFHHGTVDGHDTSRSPRDELFYEPEYGQMTPVAEQVLLALEQTDFCSFEVQFEIAHNYIHALVGDKDEYSMASLRYTAYDPLFYLHHSNTDRLWAMWQVLQGYRGLPFFTANCALTSFRQPLQPFAQPSAVNPDPITRENSIPFRVFDYTRNFHYRYDNIDFNGLSIPQLQREIVKRQSRERVFVGFMLHGIQRSALVVLDLCRVTCQKTGEFYILGDAYEMPWKYDRLFKYEITRHLADLKLRADDLYRVRYTVYDLQGQELGDNLFGNVTIVRDTGTGVRRGRVFVNVIETASHVRKNLEDLSLGETESLRSALLQMQKDGSFQKIASFHGFPGMCTHNSRSVACCVHGSPTFLHWHRLYVEQVENCLLARGSAVSVPYWDWTQPIRQLPTLISSSSFFNSRTYSKESNPFFRGKIPDIDAFTTRDPQPQLFNSNYFLDNVLLALEQTSFCDFEVQLEVTHNALHSWLGGRDKHSMSSLDYSAFDPAFFLHHANTDRLWAIWQALQQYRGLPSHESDCGLHLMRRPLQPFDSTSHNPLEITNQFSRPADVFDYTNRFSYRYDNLLFNSWTLPQLEAVLRNQRSRDRLFAGFLLRNIGTSADVLIFVCVATGNGGRSCNHPAGEFSILGGETEMPFTFDRLYKYDISESIRQLGLKLDSAAEFEVDIKVRAFNGSYLEPDLVDKPSIIFLPGAGKRQTATGRTENRLVRKNAWALSPIELRSLMWAMRLLQEDSSPNGFQALASFHALPPLCPYPEAPVRYACCVHGMPTFPQWHRLYLVQFEDALRRHSAIVGIPYWDSIEPSNIHPFLFTNNTYQDPVYKFKWSNPWESAAITFAGKKTARDFQYDRLADSDGSFGGWQWKQFVFALEQEDYCDFEVQFEIAHNAIHAWVGGSEKYSMGHLHYASFDPVFLLHHSSMDRIYALWQELQRYRGLDPNEANCALELVREPLKPFSFGSPYNLNPVTHQYSRPEDVFDYKARFNYQYDTLELMGMDAPRLQDYINKQKEKPRVFAGFLLHSLGTSAHVTFLVCSGEEYQECTHAGDFNVLGGSAEMPWSFDRLYRYEITNVLQTKGLKVDDMFQIKVVITAQNGTVLDSNSLPQPTVIFMPKNRERELQDALPSRVRRDLRDLKEVDIQNLKAAMAGFQSDKGGNGWEAITAFHGVPARCPSPQKPEKACCIHGMPTFPHWHRLYTLQVDMSVIRKGSSVALPYWDWTLPTNQLPLLFTEQTFYDAWKDEVLENPFARGYIKEIGGYTVRDPQPELLKLSADGEHSVLFDEVLLALEQTDYCDFEVQFEVVHNAIHYLVGGRQSYSLSSLHYASYDPLFFIHHSFVDKIWAVWQELQKRRHLPHDRADCAVNFMAEPMAPFNNPNVNLNPRTRAHAVPQTVFDYEGLEYVYDNLNIGDKTPDELEKLINKQRSRPRVFAGFLLHGIGTSADVVISVCVQSHCVRAGAFFILGGALEMQWSFDRLYRHDITQALLAVSVRPQDVFNEHTPFTLNYDITAVNGTRMPRSLMPQPTIIYEPASGAFRRMTSYSLAGIGVRKDINTLSEAETENLREALSAVMDDTRIISYQRLAGWHGYPGLCSMNGQQVACCQHGSASFPHWHRLFVRSLEIVMTLEGARIGIPYWDWTTTFTNLPSLLTADDSNNPFFKGHIKALNQSTSRSPRLQLFNDPERGEESFFYRQILLAFEQRDYCDFEVQFEVTHNAIHSWIGGTSPYGMSTLEYSAYDPIFFIHHSNVDRQFAIWQALQRYRSLDHNSANCNIQELKVPLEPFNRKENLITIIRENSRAIDAFNYEQFGYQYDNLNFHGLTIPELDAVLEARRQEDRVFANFMLHGIRSSADVSFDICDAQNHCSFAGTFAILGGPLEMPWVFDRLFKYDVTSVFKQLHLRPDSEYRFKMRLVAVNGTELDPHLLHAPSVSFLPGRSEQRARAAREDTVTTVSPVVTRYDLDAFTLEQASSLRNALHKLQNDHSLTSYEAIANFHAGSGLCPENASVTFACVPHGLANLPHFNRLLLVQMEMALLGKGATTGIPYWDWTRAIRALPSLVAESGDNSFFSYHIRQANEDIVRDPQEDLFVASRGTRNVLFEQTLLALEEVNFCDFLVHLDLLHVRLHALVGGSEPFSMATLENAAFDPFFWLHAANVDRVWQAWQELQKLRRRSYHSGNCARVTEETPMLPFSSDTLNPNPLTQANARPVQSVEIDKFRYSYDRLDFNGRSVAELLEATRSLRVKDRLFAAFLLSGVHTSARLHVTLQTGSDVRAVEVGSIYLLGGPRERRWAHERAYKLDITEAAARLALDPYSTFDFNVSLFDYKGQPLPYTLPYPLVLYRPASVDFDVLVYPLYADKALPTKVTVRRGTKIRFHAADPSLQGRRIRTFGSYTLFTKCDALPGDADTLSLDVTYSLKPGEYYLALDGELPGKCLEAGRTILVIDEE